jgi:hypothetical protein
LSFFDLPFSECIDLIARLITSFEVGHLTVEITTTTFQHALRILIVGTRFHECHNLPPFEKGVLIKIPWPSKATGSLNFFPHANKRLLRQPGYPRNLGPVAFRPPITRGLALSAVIKKDESQTCNMDAILLSFKPPDYPKISMSLDRRSLKTDTSLAKGYNFEQELK